MHISKRIKTTMIADYVIKFRPFGHFVFVSIVSAEYVQHKLL